MVKKSGVLFLFFTVLVGEIEHVDHILIYIAGRDPAPVCAEEEAAAGGAFVDGPVGFEQIVIVQYQDTAVFRNLTEEGQQMGPFPFAANQHFVSLCRQLFDGHLIVGPV